MLSITYRVLDRESRHTIVEGALFESSDPQVPPWFHDLPDPDHSAPTETWSPIAGDPNHVVHAYGMVSVWYDCDPMIERIMDVRPTDEREAFKKLLTEHPSVRYSWDVVATSRTFNRVSRNDPDFQAALQDTIDGGD